MPVQQQAVIDGAARRLAEKYRMLERDHISAAVEHAYARFEDSRVRDFLPVLVERSAGEILTTLTSNLSAVAVADLGVAGTQLRGVGWVGRSDGLLSGQGRAGHGG